MASRAIDLSIQDEGGADAVRPARSRPRRAGSASRRRAGVSRSRPDLPSRWSWMRAPSYLYSRAVRPPWAVSTSSKLVAGSASMGRSGTNTRGLAPARAAAPPVRARVATVERSPRKSAARRTAVESAPAASPIASRTRPSDTPVRISPEMIRQSRSCSAAVAREANSASRSSRACLDPGPTADATAPKPSATSREAQRGPAAGSARGSPRVPSTRGSEMENGRPVKYATAPAASSGSMRRRKSVTRRSFSRRPGLVSRRRQSATRSANGVTRSRGRPCQYAASQVRPCPSAMI